MAHECPIVNIVFAATQKNLFTADLITFHAMNQRGVFQIADIIGNRIITRLPVLGSKVTDQLTDGNQLSEMGAQIDEHIFEQASILNPISTDDITKQNRIAESGNGFPSGLRIRKIEKNG